MTVFVHRDTAVGSRCRVAYLTNIPSPYRTTMIRAWAQGNPDLSLSVFYTDPDDQGRGWAADAIGCGVRETRLPVLASLGRYGKLSRGLLATVREHDVLMIGGFEQASYLAAAILGRLARKPVVMLFDGFSPARFGNEPRAILALKRLTARFVDGFFANGTVGATYLRDQIGVRADRPIHNQFLSHRDEPLEQARRRFAGEGRETVRRALGIDADGRRVVMVCGYLIARKRIDLVVDAIAQLPDADRPMLLVVGTGALEDALRARAREAGIAAHFAGFHLGADLAGFYLAADLFVLASDDDPWGLVVNEAMAAGLPILVSDACGASLDLVVEGINGFVFHAGDATDLASRLARLLNMDLSGQGAASRAIINDWTPSRSALNLGRVIAAVAPSRMRDRENRP